MSVQCTQSQSENRPSFFPPLFSMNGHHCHTESDENPAVVEADEIRQRSLEEEDGSETSGEETSRGEVEVHGLIPADGRNKTWVSLVSKADCQCTLEKIFIQFTRQLIFL